MPERLGCVIEVALQAPRVEEPDQRIDLAVHGAGWVVRTQEDRACYYQHFALGALEQKNVVGWHFFKYTDDPPESKNLDNMGGANKGMFDVYGQPYAPLLKRARAVNREVYPLIRFFDARRLQGYLDDATEALRQQPASVRHTEAVSDQALACGGLRPPEFARLSLRAWV